MSGIMENDKDEVDDIAEIEAKLYEAQKFKKNFSMESQVVSHCVQTGAMIQDLIDSFQGEITLENRKSIRMLCQARNIHSEIDLNNIINYRGTKDELVASVERYNENSLKFSLEFFSTIKNKVKEFLDRNNFENEENYEKKLDKLKDLVATMKSRAKRETIPRIRVMSRDINYALYTNKKLNTIPEISKNIFEYSKLVSEGFTKIGSVAIDMQSLNKINDNLNVAQAQKLFDNWYGIAKGYCDRTIKTFDMKKFKETSKGIVYLNEEMGFGDNTWALYSYKQNDPTVDSYDAYEQGLCFEFKVYDNPNNKNALNYLDVSNATIKDLDELIDTLYKVVDYSNKISEKFEKGGLDLDKGYDELNRLIKTYREARDKKYILYTICSFIGLNNLVCDLFIKLKLECSITLISGIVFGYEIYRGKWS